MPEAAPINPCLPENNPDEAMRRRCQQYPDPSDPCHPINDTFESCEVSVEELKTDSFILKGFFLSGGVAGKPLKDDSVYGTFSFGFEFRVLDNTLPLRAYLAARFAEPFSVGDHSSLFGNATNPAGKPLTGSQVNYAAFGNYNFGGMGFGLEVPLEWINVSLYYEIWQLKFAVAIEGMWTFYNQYVPNTEGAGNLKINHSSAFELSELLHVDQDFKIFSIPFLDIFFKFRASIGNATEFSDFRTTNDTLIWGVSAFIEARLPNLN